MMWEYNNPIIGVLDVEWFTRNLASEKLQIHEDS